MASKITRNSIITERCEPPLTDSYCTISYRGCINKQALLPTNQSLKSIWLNEFGAYFIEVIDYSSISYARKTFNIDEDGS